MRAADIPGLEGFPFAIFDEDGALTIDLSPCICALVAHLDAGEDRGTLALRFHRTVCEMVVAVVLGAGRAGMVCAP